MQKMTNYTLTNLNEYKENQYDIKLKDHLEKYIDYDELHFIESELMFFVNCYVTADIKLIENEYSEVNHGDGCVDYFTRLEYGIDYSGIKGSANTIVHNEIIDFNDETSETGLYDLVRCEQLKVTFSKILSYLNDKKEQLTTQPQQTEPINETEPEQKLPYKIALLHELGFFKLDAIKKLTKEKQYKVIGALTGGTHRTIKGNVLVLDPESNDDRMKYTSNNYTDEVKNYLNKLK
jgi:hypothetical protein